MQQVRLEGFKELGQNLNSLPTRVRDRALQRAVISAMRPAGKDLRSAAPVSDENNRSKISQKYGHLKKNIKLKRVKAVEFWERAARWVTTNAPQGYWYEHGTRYQPARPWFAPAFGRAASGIFGRLGAAISEAIEREFTRGK